ncbi:MAG: protein kinase [Spirochaetes bacterium]|nr:protein kinase [Spirochaetota bacterium]
MVELIKKALQGDKFSIAKLVSYFESTKIADRQFCVELDAKLDEASVRAGIIVGLTGAPGAGKSTLIQHLVDALLLQKPEWNIAVVAVDPSSPVSGGALLGDRTRVNFGENERAYFRSQASDLDLGGIGRNTFRVCRLLRRLFDLVLVESVGVGQSEIEIARLADVTLLALQPFSGDHIQFMKSGIMEIPQAFVITKCDAEDLAQKSLYQLQSSLDFMQRIDAKTKPPAIFQTSSVRQSGFDALAAFVAAAKRLDSAGEVSREDYFLKKEIRHYYGEFGLRALATYLQAASGSFEKRRLDLLEKLAQKLEGHAAP